MAGNPFAELLRELRRRHGLSQAELGGDACTRAHVSAIEKGHGTPSGFVVRRFFERLPERMLLAEAFTRSYPPRPDWIHAGIYLALQGEPEAARILFRSLAGGGGRESAARSGFIDRAQGWEEYLAGRLDRALDLLASATGQHRRAGQYREAGWTLWELGLMASSASPGPEALRCFQAARATWPRSGTAERRRFDAIVLHSESRVLRRMGCYNRARRAAGEAVRLYRETGDLVGEGHALLEQAYAAHDAGYRGALGLLGDEALGLFQRSGHHSCLGVAELAVAIALVDEGPDRFQEAVARLENAERLLAAQAGGQVVHALSERARVALALGDRPAAEAYLRRALELPASPDERSQHLCLAAAAGLQEWPATRQALIRLSRDLTSPWERRTYFRSAARSCEGLRRWEWATELHRLSHDAWEGSWQAQPFHGEIPHLAGLFTRVS